MKGNDEVIADFNEYVNMTASELESWLKSDDSNSAGWPKSDGNGESVGHDSGRKIVEILKSNPKKDPKKYTDDQVEHMRKVAAYCKRHLAQESAGNDEKSEEDLKKTKSYASLKNWGHDPLKTRGGSSSKSNGKSKATNGSKQNNGNKKEQNGDGEDEENDEEEEQAEADDNDDEEAEDAYEEEDEEDEDEAADDDQDDDVDDDAKNKKAGDKRKKSGQQTGPKKKQETRKLRSSDKKKQEEEEDEEEDAGEEDEDDQEDDDDAKEDDDKKTDTKKSGKQSNGGSKNGPKKGDTVSWNWGGGQPKGKVLDVKEDKATITTKNGNEVSRNGDPEDPAVVLDAGKSKAIKSAHELN